MKNLIKIQPSAFTDQIRDGHQMTKLPYPFFVEEDGSVANQDLWRGNPAKVIGFQADLAVSQIDLWWADAVKDPARAVGMYLVTADVMGSWETHMTAIETVEMLRPEPDVVSEASSRNFDWRESKDTQTWWGSRNALVIFTITYMPLREDQDGRPYELFSRLPGQTGFNLGLMTLEQAMDKADRRWEEWVHMMGLKPGQEWWRDRDGD